MGNTLTYGFGKFTKVKVFFLQHATYVAEG